MAAVAAVIWNGFGVSMYLSSVGVIGDPMVGLDEAETAAASSTPAWITASFAVDRFAGLLGSIALLFRKAWAQPALLVSMAALLTLEGWTVFLSGAREIFGIAVPITVGLCAILLASLAVHARRRGWLGA